MGKPGDKLHDKIRDWTGMNPEMSCKCRQWINKMNTEGPEWCIKHLDEIVAHFISEAKAHAKEWRIAPVDDNGTILNYVLHKVWGGGYWVPGSGLALAPFVRHMVVSAIRESEEESQSA